MPRRGRPAAGRRAARRRQLRMSAPAPVAGIHTRRPVVARTRDRRQHGDLHAHRHRAGQDAAGRRSAAPVLRRQLRREVRRQQRPSVSVLRAPPRSQPLSLEHRRVRHAHVQGVDRRCAGASARAVRLRVLLRSARYPREPRTNADAGGRFRAWPRRSRWPRRGDQRWLLDAPVRERSRRAREERPGRNAVGDHRRRHATGILRASGRGAARHHASHDARRTGSAIEAELVAERDRASRARRERRGGARGSGGAVGRLLDGSRDASRQARVLQRHRARPRGQGRQRAASAPTRSR